LSLPVFVFSLDSSLAQVNFSKVTKFGNNHAKERYILKQEKSEVIREIAIYLAVSKEGVIEDPPNSNSGKDINEFLNSVGLKPGNEWCVSFCQWAYRNAAGFLGVNFNMIKTGHSLSAFSFAKKFGSGIDENIKRGDWIIFQRGETWKGHCGIVLSFDGKVLYTIEGNVTPNESANNQGVFRKVRNINKFGWLKIVGFIGFE
jgi:hypothetical protein